MNDFDQKRADRDAILYNTDGRNFDLKLQEQRLEIVTRPATFVLWMCWAFLPAPVMVWFVPVGALPMWQRYLLLGAVMGATDVIVHLIIKRNGGLQPKRWILDQTMGQFCADKREIARLDEIIAVRGWKRGRRFLLAVRLREGREIRLGLMKFGGKEWAWRHDAAQIAAFLGVPLEIPPVIPA